MGSCTGIYADVVHSKDMELFDNTNLLEIVKMYKDHKARYGRNIRFNETNPKKGEFKQLITLF